MRMKDYSNKQNRGSRKIKLKIQLIDCKYDKYFVS